MLRCMQQPAQTQPSAASANFAGMMAALTSPSRDEANPATGWNESDLGDDVVTLSYEHALNAHARYKPAGANGWPALATGSAKPSETHERPARPAAQVDEGLDEQAGQTLQIASDRDLRSASVTIRLSKAECARLHQRAAEARVTVSAYLRSCTFEAEALRAQVKAALAELKAAASREKPVVPAKERRTFLEWIAFGWLARLLTRRQSASQSVLSQ